jgi:hypothetical protein
MDAMIWGLKRVIKYALGTDIAGRSLAVYPDDAFIVSYPRSGNTWTRFLVANLVHPEQQITFANIERLIPDCEAMSSRYMRRVPRPRIIKSHQCFDPRYKRVIYMARDPRDVVVSQYHFQRKRNLIADQFPLSEFVGRFLAGQTCFYGSWGENVASWLATQRGQPGFLLLRYEDMLDNTARELSKVDSFLGLTTSPHLIMQAVERSCADTMRQLEKLQAQLFTSTKDTRQDIPFVRTAKAGGWRSELPEECARQIEEAWGDLMQRLGYEMLSTDAAGRREDCA